MKVSIAFLPVVAACAMLPLPHLTSAQTTLATPATITTPDKVQTRLGTLDFKDGAPSKATLDKVYDNLDFTHAFRAFMDTMRGVSVHAVRKGLLSIGVKDNEVMPLGEIENADGIDRVRVGSDLASIKSENTQPVGVKRGNWIQTILDKGWFVILRLYSPLEPFFTKQWRPIEIELAK